jgi:hypothetical protein
VAKLDLNLDAYRLIAELLSRLRQAIRHELRQRAGDAWEELLPEDLRLFLTQRRQREQGVSWFATDSFDLLDYAGFAEAAEILAATPSLLQRLDWLPPTNRETMLRVRFLELDTVFQRVAYARPVSELEMELLAGLGERVKRSLEGIAPAKEPPTPKPAPAPSPAAETAAAPAPPKEKPPAAAPPSTPEVARPHDQISEALAAGDTKAIMQALYKEVVATADAIFKEGRGPACPIWELVRESSWYAENFRKLSLAPLSHFFDIVEDTKALAQTASREEVLEAVRNRAFAQTLLQLKELFQPYLSPSP